MYIYRFTQALRRGGCTVTPVKMYVTLPLCMKLAGVNSCRMWWHTHKMRFRMWRGDTRADIAMCWVAGLSALKWNCWVLWCSSDKRDSRICLMPENCTSTNDYWQNLLSFWFLVSPLKQKGRYHFLPLDEFVFCLKGTYYSSLNYVSSANKYEGKSIGKLQIVIEKRRMGIMTYKQHIFQCNIQTNLNTCPNISCPWKPAA